MARTLFTINLASIIGTDSALSVGAELHFFEEDGVTEAVTYTTSDGATQNANPMLSQADGRFAQQAWLEPANYVYALVAPGGSVADPLFTGEFVVAAAPASFDPALDDFLQGDDPLPIANGGTASTNAPDALTALAALPLAGGTVTGNITRSTKGVHLYFNTAAMANGGVFLTVDSDPDPTTLAGQIWMTYA